MIQMAGRTAKKAGMARRDFLRTACGTATAFAAMNRVFGDFFVVEAAETTEAGAAEESKTDYFVFDVQTHHVAVGQAGAPLNFRRMGGVFNPELNQKSATAEDLYLENYVKEVFLDSETDVACISGIPSRTDETNILPAEEMVKTRDWTNHITRSHRMVSHGHFAPDLGTKNKERMHLQAEKLKIDAWKGYTGLGLGDADGWWIDDEETAYPALELSEQLGITNICLHKGLALGMFKESYCHPKDIVKASKDFPDLNFLIYHSGFRSLQSALPAARDNFRKNSYVPWVSDLCRDRKAHPHMTNVYMELGSTFGMMAITYPSLCAHVLGMIIDAFGSDHVLWGTDSIWWGSPQWQIEALRRLKMPEQLMEQFGYEPLTTEVKRKIFGLNAARLYGVDPEAKRNAMPGDYIDDLRKSYQQAGASTPSNTQYGWVRSPYRR